MFGCLNQEQLDAIVGKAMKSKEEYTLATDEGLGDYIREKAIPDIIAGGVVLNDPRSRSARLIGQILGDIPDPMEGVMNPFNLMLFYDATLVCLAHSDACEKGRSPLYAFQLQDGQYQPQVYIDSVRVRVAQPVVRQ